MKIKLSEAAKAEILKQDMKGKAARIYVAGFGWGGPKLGLSLDEIKDTDVVRDIDGVKFVIEKSLDQQYQEVLVDYEKSWFGKQFVVSLGYGGGCC